MLVFCGRPERRFFGEPFRAGAAFAEAALTCVGLLDRSPLSSSVLEDLLDPKNSGSSGCPEEVMNSLLLHPSIEFNVQF